jgi:hypothetical protein
LIEDVTDVPLQDAPLSSAPSISHALPPALQASQVEVLTIDRYGLGRLVTGADLSRLVFDGTSTSVNDHLIDLDSPSMETDIDVRAYFWMVGDELYPDSEPLKHTLEEAREYDNKVVRQGRLHLQECRDQGHG